MSKFDIKATYDFNTYSPGMLGNYREVVVEGIVHADVAKQFDDIAATHANVLGSLPQGTPADYKAFDYVLISTSSGKIAAIGLPWIIENTISRRDSGSLRIVVRSGGQDSAGRIRRLLSADGFEIDSIELI